MDGVVYFTSWHIIPFTVAKINQPIQVVAACSFDLQVHHQPSPTAVVLSLGCALRSSGVGADLETT